MTEVIVAENAGFCPGVRAATERLARRIARRVYDLEKGAYIGLRPE